MFALNLVKLLVAAIIVGVLWYGYKWITGKVGKPRPDQDSDTLEMKECPVCGVYRSAQDTTACERDDCPYR